MKWSLWKVVQCWFDYRNYINACNERGRTADSFGDFVHGREVEAILQRLEDAKSREVQP